MDKVDNIDLIRSMTTSKDGLLGEVKYKKGLGLLLPIEIQGKIYYLVVEREVLKEMLEDLNGQDDLR